MRHSIFPLDRLSAKCRGLVSLGHNMCWTPPAGWGLTQVEMCFKCQARNPQAEPPIDTLRPIGLSVRERVFQILAEDPSLLRFYRPWWNEEGCLICSGRIRTASDQPWLCTTCRKFVNYPKRAQIKRRLAELAGEVWTKGPLTAPVGEEGGVPKRVNV